MTSLTIPLSHTHSPLDVDVAHSLPRCHGDLVQHHVTGIPHHHTQHILVGLARFDGDWVWNVEVFPQYVHPHVELALRDAWLDRVVKVACLHMFRNEPLLSEYVQSKSLLHCISEAIMSRLVIL